MDGPAGDSPLANRRKGTAECKQSDPVERAERHVRLDAGTPISARAMAVSSATLRPNATSPTARSPNRLLPPRTVPCTTAKTPSPINSAPSNTLRSSRM